MAKVVADTRPLRRWTVRCEVTVVRHVEVVATCAENAKALAEDGDIPPADDTVLRWNATAAIPHTGQACGACGEPYDSEGEPVDCCGLLDLCPECRKAHSEHPAER